MPLLLTAEQPQEIRRAGVTELPVTLSRALDAHYAHVLDLFRAADADGDGIISRDELGTLLRGLKIGISPADLRVLFDSLDPDESGGIDLRELRQKMQPPRARTPRTPRSARTASTSRSGRGNPAQPSPRQATGYDTHWKVPGCFSNWRMRHDEERVIRSSEPHHQWGWPKPATPRALAPPRAAPFVVDAVASVPVRAAAFSTSAAFASTSPSLHHQPHLATG